MAKETRELFPLALGMLGERVLAKLADVSSPYGDKDLVKP
jgi:hypothetical protein